MKLNKEEVDIILRACEKAKPVFDAMQSSVKEAKSQTRLEQTKAKFSEIFKEDAEDSGLPVNPMLPVVVNIAAEKLIEVYEASGKPFDGPSLGILGKARAVIAVQDDKIREDWVCSDNGAVRASRTDLETHKFEAPRHFNIHASEVNP